MDIVGVRCPGLKRKLSRLLPVGVLRALNALRYFVNRRRAIGRVN